MNPKQATADPVDRRQRSELAATIRRFLHEEITGFEFDELLDPFHDSRDSAVRFVASAVWYHYDDCRDHLAALSKPEWDYFQRLLLLLESDRVVHSETVRRWSWSQLIACLGLLGFVYAALQIGWGYELIAAAVPLGLLSIGISYSRRPSEVDDPYEPMVFPFGSFADLKAAYVRARFKKARYPGDLDRRPIQPPLLRIIYATWFHALWLILSPVVLGLQMLPRRSTRVRVGAA